MITYQNVARCLSETQMFSDTEQEFDPFATGKGSGAITHLSDWKDCGLAENGFQMSWALDSSRERRSSMDKLCKLLIMRKYSFASVCDVVSGCSD